MTRADKGRRVVCRAVEDFRAELDGEPVAVSAGSLFDEAHPLVLANPERFVAEVVRYEVEQATAAPGERRER